MKNIIANFLRFAILLTWDFFAYQTRYTISKNRRYMIERICIRESDATWHGAMFDYVCSDVTRANAVRHEYVDRLRNFRGAV